MCRSYLRILIVFVATVSVGCSSLDIMSVMKRKKYVEAGPKNPVGDVICLWEPAEGRGLDSMPARGFAGQLLFLSRNSAEPAKIKGEVRIYVFDDQGSVEDQAKPLHQFDFGSEAFQQYFYETSFGGAYQLFIPYTRKGSHEAKCGLRVRFTPADGGPPVYSKMADVILPGAKPKSSAQRWNPEHRQLRADRVEGTGAPPEAGGQGPHHSDSPAALKFAQGGGSLHLKSDSRTAQAQSRLQKLAAQLAQEQPAGQSVQQAIYETEAAPGSTPQSFRLNREQLRPE